ncbi:C40 family peptidase [uncultured Mucilaginibacter sp.]|uniref:C40 family peptidase n=1 Tax=uncultured Mucilaginibacter sp. TaxID=797541 RepID=UPI0025FE743A|nr:C40 family peptidase [uncultured Mucilaginibacter sp.]
MRHGLRLLTIIVIAIAFTACHSRKKKGKDMAEVVFKPSASKPSSSLASKYAEILEVPKGDIKNGRLYAFIDEWMGTPYLYGGMDKSGTDCSGFVYQLQQQVYGITLPRTTGEQVNVIKRKYEEELHEGDLVFWDYDGKKFSHVGVYLQNGYVVHVSTRKGVMIVKLHDPSMYKYFSRCGSVLASTP